MARAREAEERAERRVKEAEERAERRVREAEERTHTDALMARIIARLDDQSCHGPSVVV